MKSVSKVGLIILVVGLSLPGVAADTDRASSDSARKDSTSESSAHARVAASGAPAAIPWVSVNQGGAIRLESASYGLGATVGQDVAGSLEAGGLRLGVGFWYGVEGSAGASCPIALTGDVNVSGDVNSTDIVYLVNYVLKAGPVPIPCAATGDANCTGDVNSTDIILLVNYVLKAGPPPCDVCTLIPGTWGCL